MNRIDADSLEILATGPSSRGRLKPLGIHGIGAAGIALVIGGVAGMLRGGKRRPGRAGA